MTPSPSSPSPPSRVDYIFPYSASTHVASQNPSQFYELDEDEEVWRDRFAFLLQRGLELRSRYNPAWIPSWFDTNLHPESCEDSLRKTLHPVLDAKRCNDGAIVCIKRIAQKSSDFEFARTEVEISRFLSTEIMLHDPTNHCVPILDHFLDPIYPEVEYIVMPLLRPYNDPAFCVVGEVVDFVTQLLEGVSFIHGHLVANGDLTSQNIMMDARPILPQGWHFVERQRAPNSFHPIVPLSRMDHPVRYVIIDYDYSTRFGPAQSHIVRAVGGNRSDRYEICYDAFKEDVFTLGNVFDKDFYQVYEGVEFLKAQIDTMKTPNFQQRPSAHAALQFWLNVKSNLEISITHWHLGKRTESVGERALLDAISVARGSIDSVKSMFNPLVSLVF